MRLRWSILALVALSSALRGQTSLTGYVRDDESLRGLPDVELSVDGSDRKVRTDKDGKYTFRDLPAGALRLHLRLVGFAPIDTILTLEAGRHEAVFFLGKHAVALDTVVTNSGRTAGAGFESFEIRRSKGYGRFLDSTALRQRDNRQLADVLRELGTINLVVPATCRGSSTLWCNWRVATNRSASRADAVCASQIVLDGQIISRGMVIPVADAPPFSPPAVVAAYERDKERAWQKAFDVNSIGVSGLRGVEVYRSAADAQDVFGGGDADCGVVVLWTRRS